MKKLSCGILVMNVQQELLLCHATGTWHWDIPKGGMDPGESPHETALRETAEETGLQFEAGELLELGRLRYRPDKELHLFAVLSERFDAASCHCHSQFVDNWGRRRPEMDDFDWTPFTRVHRRVGRHMATLLTQTLSLPTLLHQLLAARGIER